MFSTFETLEEIPHKCWICGKRATHYYFKKSWIDSIRLRFYCDGCSKPTKEKMDKVRI